MANKEDLMDMLLAEYTYWRGVDNPKTMDFAMGAMGALSNVVAAVALDLSAEEFKKRIAERDKPIR